MDTFKEKQELDDLCTKGGGPWELWKKKAVEKSGVLVAASHTIKL